MRPLGAFLLSLLLPGLASAECDCLWGGPFTRVQADTDLVVAARVIGGKGNSVDLQLEQVLRGEVFREEVRLWLDTGALCRPAAESFPADSRWVLALDRIDEIPPGGFDPGTPNLSFGRVGDYSLSRCGGYYLKLEGDMVTGNLSGGPRWEMAPEMSPVLLQLVAGFVVGALDEQALIEAGRTDPELQRLKLETRSFLRQQGSYLPPPE